MCIGIPMQVVAVAGGRATCRGRDGARSVDLALVGEVEPGAWLLVFLDSARERIDAARAAEVDATLDLVAHALAGATPVAAAAFALPSGMSAEALRTLTGCDPAHP